MRKPGTGFLQIIYFSSSLLFVSAIILSGCAPGKASISVSKKYSPAELKKDYAVFQNILEESHPGLYWYSSRDSMDYFFKRGYEQLKDSMTEAQFRQTLSYVIARIHCGHTAVRPSARKRVGPLDSLGANVFPLSLKIWDDTVVVAANLNRNDSVLKRGTVITGINGRPVIEIVDSLLKFISADGYNKTHKWQTLSNRGNFGSLYTSVFGHSAKYEISFLDFGGHPGIVTVPAYKPRLDTTADRRLQEFSKSQRKQMNIESARSLKMDTANHISVMSLNTFARGARLRSFIRSSFRSFAKHRSEYLIVDLRSNGGGSVTNSTLLTRYIARSPFKVADSLYAIKRKSSYGTYIKNNFFNGIFLRVFTRKNNAGYYHFGYFERHRFKPKKKNHFDGRVFILTGGNSFSASTLFVHSVMNQENVTVVGEETGGGAYGNSAWLIPDVTLPHTGIRFRLPLFRLVIDKNIPKDGRGIMPHVESKPSVEAIRQGKDFKMEKALQLIQEEKKRLEK
jgi:hypothetical protein